jgi:uncharacterized repeat protein (TIGR03803 family)
MCIGAYGGRYVCNASSVIEGCAAARCGVRIARAARRCAGAGFKTLYSFAGNANGGHPDASLIMDASGNLYGTTTEDSETGKKGCPAHCGSVFKLAPNGTQTVLYTFKGGSDGSEPKGSLLADTAGNLYGTTAAGGANGWGTVFKVAPNGTETVLYSFAHGDGGWMPLAGLIADSAGNLYGTTDAGGTADFGTVFKLAPDGTETVLYSFQGGNDGKIPVDTLLADSAGNLYGTTFEGGGTGCGGGGCGTVFKLAPDGTETVLYAFQGGNDGSSPYAGLIADASGNLYGTASEGGVHGSGVVFEVAPNGTETVLYSFTNGADGGDPQGSLIADVAGNLYSTTYGGGANKDGTVFKLAPSGTETVLHSFAGKKDGQWLAAGVIADAKGNLYGTTSNGGKKKQGTVFSIPE